MDIKQCWQDIENNFRIFMALNKYLQSEVCL